MANTPPRFDTLLRAATGPGRIAPLLRALGFPALSPLPRVAPQAWGLAGVEGVRRVFAAGERGGVAALVVELDDAGPEATARVARRVRAYNPARLHLFVFAAARYRRLVFASFGLGGELRRLVVERAAPKRTDVETLEELAARDGEGGVALAWRHARALDRSRVTRQFFRDFRVQRARIAAAWTGIAPGAAADREALALLLLSRLMFLYFLQREGHLAGDPAYLPSLLDRWRRAPGAGTFYRAVLRPLFFGALNTRPERRCAEARALGALPYLNGGLFERHAIERRHPALDLPDDAVAGAFDGLLERYRFTTCEAVEAAADGAGDVGVDPEMLGRVFEALMAADRRSASGTFYTPAAVVDRLVTCALETHLAGAAGLDPRSAARLVRDGDASGIAPDRRRELARTVEALRVLDPACGSGAFLLGALTRLTRVRVALGAADRAAVRRDIVGRCLHGVDVQDDAALLCALRLWLALAVEEPGAPDGAGRVAPRRVEPLPNLDRRIRQGDALLDPLDLVAAAGLEDAMGNIALDAGVRRALRAIPPLAGRYLCAGPEDRPALRRELVRAETGLAVAWLDGIERRFLARRSEWAAQAAARDLFGERPAAARRAEAAARDVDRRLAELDRLRAALDDGGALPFFSFDIHFAEAAGRGFDLVLSNPPWVRAHRWPAAVGRLVRSRYAVCRGAGWRRGAQLAGAPGGVAAQVDLSLLFLERSLRLLAPGGTLAMLLPAKALRSLYGAGARRMLLEETSLASIEDYGLDQRAIFRADAFTAAVVARKGGAGTRVARGAEAGPEAGVGAGGGGMPDAHRDGTSGADRGAVSGAHQDRTSGADRDAAAAGGDCARPRTPGADPDATAARADRAPPHAPGAGPDRWARPDSPVVRVSIARRGAEPLRFCIPQCDLPVLPDDPESPWMLAPPDARAALRRMQAAGPPLGAIPGLRIRRGVVTGANDVLIFRHVAPKLGGLAHVRALGYDRARRDGRAVADSRRFQALIEDDALRPLVRGCDLAAWRFRTTDHVCWVHDDRTAAPHAPPPRLARYLERHRDALRARSGERDAIAPGALFRVSTTTLAPKVAWHDLARTLEAAALPARVRGPAGRDVPLIPLNTVYFVPARSDQQALLLAAYLNSLPARTFARAIAERAKDARFRFLAWTIALVPLPRAWDAGPAAARLREISARAHERRAIAPGDEDELNAIVASAYGLTSDDMTALRSFDLWLRGDPR
ncbi:MAG TPA: DNA methyltransferase [Longimicrobiales bacterium]